MEQLETNENPRIPRGVLVEKRAFAGLGVVLIGAAAYFVWRDLGVSAEYLLVAVAVVATALEIIQCPRDRPHVGLSILLACTLAAGVCFAGAAYFGYVPAGSARPFVLFATMGIAAIGGIVALARAYLTQREGWLSARLVYSMTIIAIVLSAALYYQLFTIGFAAEHVARRLILTLTWLPIGVLMQATGHARGERHLAGAGLLLVACAVAKAILYDTTHLDGGLRIAVLGVAGLILLGGAWLLHAGERARA
jgi:uncharacterized membrane protein